MVEVIINGTSIDLISKGVKYTKQANDFADISTVNTSFTYSIRADKTPKNTQLFEQLGMVGDTSRIPYTRNVTQLIDNGAVLIEKGLATVKETNDEYKLFIQDGIIEVFKLIENKFLGVHLDLSELQHSKTAETIIDSWSGINPYRYLIADYNGKTNDGDAILAQYQIPSVNVKYLWDKVFNYIGYTYSGDFEFIRNKWISYPKPPEVEEDQTSYSFIGLKQDYSGEWNDSYKQWDSYTPNNLEDVTLLTNNGKRWRLKVNFTGSYQLLFNTRGDIGLIFPFPLGFLSANYRMNLLIDGEVVDSAVSNSGAKTYSGIIQSDSVVEVEIVAPDSMDIDFDVNGQRVAYEKGDYTIAGLNVDIINFFVINKGKEDIDFQSVLSDFSIKEFFKEIMVRGGLTPFPDNINRHIDFKNLKQRLSTSTENVNDLSDKVVRRTNEKYSFGTYAQKNLLKLKYNNQEENYNDGFISVDNINIEDEKTLFQSKFYSPERETSTVVFPLFEKELPLLKVWDKEIKDSNGVQEIEYKPLNNRFYFLSAEWEFDKTVKINTIEKFGFYSASLKNTTMREVVNTKYNLIDRIFTDTRIHDFDLVLTAHEFQALPLDKLHYIEQEGQFYILNKVIWETGQIAKGEFLRVKKI